MTLEVIVCETCRRPDVAAGEARAGAAFAAALEAALAAETALAGTRLRRIRCLMACRRACTVHLRAPGKMGYVLGAFGPEPELTAALIAYLHQYHQSADGIVPYRHWPEGIKGKFIARVPPLPAPE